MLRKICFIEVVCHYWCRIFLFSCRSNIILEAPKDINPRDYTLLRNAKIMLLFFFRLEQMQLFALIPSANTIISILVSGKEVLQIAFKKEAQAGGMMKIEKMLFTQILTVSIRFVEVKPRLISTGAIQLQRGAPRAALLNHLK